MRATKYFRCSVDLTNSRSGTLKLSSPKEMLKESSTFYLMHSPKDARIWSVFSSF
ncbi:uncharacterized protein PHALS_14138 [Plasmopara halstedii]|uniref:Uncharacterized protein n=1 Tax=Plasmopara halstedii TaxID=4781 RepID=A0A0P1AR08_PLAHL|nr:uncharacterized protein PHALS_14138 [Plasmopara halstedii]CEG43849.1 hypothetical protein PHALS_14138 [Plasmopara halstedii]|eukprot:XP_024580218.1 hypothetical protein PHALS_14138 [Plasmopara halstedii]